MISNKEFSRLYEEAAREDYDKIRSWPERISSLEEENRRMREALDEYETSMRNIGGCGSNSCVVRAPDGWGTNGPCYCPKDPQLARQAMTAASRFRKAARAALGQEQKP